MLIERSLGRWRMGLEWEKAEARVDVVDRWQDIRRDWRI